MCNGLPVLASVNEGNDLIDMIETKQVGCAFAGNAPERLISKVEHLVGLTKEDNTMSGRCRELAESLFTPQVAVKQIVQGLQAVRLSCRVST